jgi:HK97 family phage portal protein
MGLIQNVVSWAFKDQLTKLQKEVEQSIGSQVIGKILQPVGSNPVYMPDNVEAYINQGYLFNPTVYSIVSFIAQKCGSIPWYVYSVKNDKALNLYKSASPDLPQYKKDIVKTKALVELHDHELQQLFTTPNVLQSWAEFCEQFVGYKLVTGNSYLHCIGPTAGVNQGLVKELWNLPSQLVVIVPGDQMQPVKQYEIKGDRSTVVPAEQVIHLKYWTPNYMNGSFLYGVSPIQAGRRVVTRSNSSYDASVAAFQNMGANGIISAGDGSTEEPFTEEQAEMISQRYKRITGPKNAGKPIITAANIKWQQMGMSPVDLQIIESDRMDLRTMCNIFHVPSELFNDAANKTYSNTKEAGSAVYTNAVIPALTQFRDAFNSYIYPRYGGQIYVDFDTSMISELQDDLSALATALSGCWWLKPNERREVMKFDSDEENPMMNEYLIPAGLVPMTGDMLAIDDTQLDEALTEEPEEEETEEDTKEDNG